LGNALSGQNIKASLEENMCKCFIRELKLEIEQRIVRHLAQETADTLQIKRELRLMSDLRQRQDTLSKTNTNHIISHTNHKS